MKRLLSCNMGLFDPSKRNISRLTSTCDLQKFIKDFVQSEIAPRAESIDSDAKMPKDLLRSLHQSGLLGVTLSTENRGSGLHYSALSLIVEEISRVCGSTGSMVSIHNCLFADILQRRGSPRQIQDILIPLYEEGERLGAFALSETNAGSDVAAMTTKADKSGDHWILNGRKAWVTSARESRHCIVFATVDKELLHRGISAFIVDLSAPGVTIERNEDKLGIRGTSTCSIALEDVLVSKDHVVGQIGEGFKIAMAQLDVARLGIASQALGLAQASVDVAIKHLRQNLQYDQPSKLRLAEMAMNVEAARLVVRKAAEGRALRSPQMNTKYSSMGKVMASQCATSNAHSLIGLMGVPGLAKGSHAERIIRDSRITEIYGGVTDIQKLIIADQVLRGN